MPPCPFCLSSDVKEILTAREMAKGTREPFRFAVCSDCGSAQNLDFPENISSYYEGYYSFADDRLTLENVWWKRAAVTLYAWLVVRMNLSRLLCSLYRRPGPRQMRVLSPNLQAFLCIGANARARILDVGSGRGQFVRMLRRFGYINASGIDPFLDDGVASPFIKRRDLESENQIYDLILFNHTFEHVTNPETTLRKCVSLLADRGVIVIHVPNMAAEEFHRFKENWCWLHAPYHFAIPSQEGLERMSERCGFKVVDQICTSRFDHYLYHDEYRRDIADPDARSERRNLERGTFDNNRWLKLSSLAHQLNENLTGDWVAYYLVKDDVVVQ